LGTRLTSNPDRGKLRPGHCDMLQLLGEIEIGTSPAVADSELEGGAVVVVVVEATLDLA